MIYYDYLIYVLLHKWRYFIKAMKRGRIIAAFTHDLSKFRPSEFIPYAHFFCRRPYSSDKLPKIKDDFAMAWLLHQRRNKHHWNYWAKSDGLPVPMPKKYIIQMVCDWEAMGIAHGNTAKEHYIKNKKSMIMHYETIRVLVTVLK